MTSDELRAKAELITGRDGQMRAYTPMATAEAALAECERERDEALGLLPGKLKGAQALADEKSRCFYERAIAAERKLAAAREAVKANLTNHNEVHGELDCVACAYKRGVRHSLEALAALTEVGEQEKK